MANGTRILSLVLVFIVGTAAGWLIGCARTTPPAPPAQASECPTTMTAPVPPQAWKLFVENDETGKPCKVTDGNGVERKVVVIKASDPTNIIEFASKDSTQKHRLAITIHVPPNTALPFRNLAFNGIDPQGQLKMLLVCDDAEGSKPCKAVAVPMYSKDTCYYKYDQTLDNQTCDAGIIIQP